MITDAELQGVALQALNLAKVDREQATLCCVLATYHEGEGIHRMRAFENSLIEKLGLDWPNNDRSKTFAFNAIRFAIRLMRCDAFIFVSAGNMFQRTEAFNRLHPAQQKALWNSTHDRHHDAVKEGLLSIHDTLQAIAQTISRVCLYIQRIDDNHNFEGPPELKLCDQRDFVGRLKMFGPGVKTR